MPWGTVMQSTRAEEAGAPASSAAARHGLGHESTTGAASSAAPSPTRTGRRGSREREGPATTLDATVRPWRRAKQAGGRPRSRASRRSPSKPTASGATSSGSGSGPAVIVISEMPGHHPAGGAVRPAGGRRRMHGRAADLFGDPGRPASAGYALRSIGPACISREFSAFALKKTSPVTVWLRKLAAAEHERCGGPGVGVVGMCFTGGFALAMMVDDVVLAPVLSQPSLPFPLSKSHKADIGISDADLARVKERTAAGTCLLGLRFSNDPFCFAERFETLRRELGDAFIAVEIDSAPGNPHGHPKSAHSVLTEHLSTRRGRRRGRRWTRRSASSARSSVWARVRAHGPRGCLLGLRPGPAGSPRRRARPSAPRRPSRRTTPTPSRCRPSGPGRPARAAGARTGSARRWGSGPGSSRAVQRSSAQFTSRTSSGVAALGPNRVTAW